ncbi:MarR family transcriptional regulator [Streptomyces sp. NPDC051322]|uniref:MarR family transcriptional regulator n=1 Tax=Streptomyces sp. NPDC051322 TaxID=3154645 RepID=UPI00344D5090
MAVQNFSAALRAPASRPVHPMAAPGYGKRSAPDQAPRRADDFLALPERERYIAAFLDRLPDGASMTIKALAKQLPSYGQQAVSTALTALSVAGHLRRVRCLAETGEQVRWVSRTFWSRTARDNEWWCAFLAAQEGRAAADVAVPASPPAVPVLEEAEAGAQTPVAPADSVPPAPSAPVAARQLESEPRPSPGYLALVQLGCVEPRLALSAADCETLEGLAMEWLARGVTPVYIVQVLTTGLPAEPINSPLGFVRRRLREKKPPYQPTAPTAGTAGARLMVECTKCGIPGRPEAVPDGLCHACRPAAPGARRTVTDADAEAVAAREVHARVEALRGLAHTP